MAAFGAVSLAGFAQAADFTNGSFESSVHNTTTSPPWVVTGNLRFIDSNLNDEGTTDGVFSTAFNVGQNTPNAVLSQTFDTVALQLYTVTFDWGNFGADVTQRMQIQVVDGTSGPDLITSGSGTVTNGNGSDATIIQNTNIIQIQDSTGEIPAVSGPAPNAEFGTISFEFIAQSAVSTIIFTDITLGTAQNSDHILDNVQIVPEPSTGAMMILGAGALFGMLRLTRNSRR